MPVCCVMSGRGAPRERQDLGLRFGRAAPKRVMGVAISADGVSTGSVVYRLGFIILLLCGAMIGAWFDFLHWLVLLPGSFAIPFGGRK